MAINTGGAKPTYGGAAAGHKLAPSLSKTESLTSPTSARNVTPQHQDKIATAINLIRNRNRPNLNELFEEFDPYDGRIFHLWEVKEIFDYKLDEQTIDSICKANQEDTPLRARCV